MAWNWQNFGLGSVFGLGPGAILGRYGEDVARWRDQRSGGLSEEQIQNTSLPYFQEQYDQATMDAGQMRQHLQWDPAQVGNSQYSGNARALVNQLSQQASGDGPSLADMQFRQASQEGIAAQRANAAGGRGPQGARFAASNIARTQAGMASGSAQARTQEQMAARSQLGQAIGMADGMDYQRQAMNAQLQQQASQANQAAYLDLLGKQLGLSRAQLDALIAQNNARLGQAGLPTNMDRVIQVGSQVGPVIAGG